MSHVSGEQGADYQPTVIGTVEQSIRDYLAVELTDFGGFSVDVDFVQENVEVNVVTAQVRELMSGGVARLRGIQDALGKRLGREVGVWAVRPR